MIQLNIEGSEFFNEQKEEFYYTNPCVVTLEHSLLSVAKWESKWKKPFLSSRKDDTFTIAALYDYFRCMEVEPCSEPMWPVSLSPRQYTDLIKYIDKEQTATKFYSYKKDKSLSRQTVTSEMIYYWMASLNIPFECERWHLSRLLTLIHVASVKGQTGKKMTKQETMAMYAELNEKRRQQYKTRG